MHRPFLRRHQPPPCDGCSIKAGIAAALALGLLTLLGESGGTAMLIAPFGASAVLLFAVPDSHLSQPMNVVGGHVLSAAIAMALDAVLPAGTASMILAVGIVSAAMSLARLVHPPAGALPLIVMTMHPGPSFVLAPVGLGAVALVAAAFVLHRLPPTRPYPLPIEPGPR